MKLEQYDITRLEIRLGLGILLVEQTTSNRIMQLSSFIKTQTILTYVNIWMHVYSKLFSVGSDRWDMNREMSFKLLSMHFILYACVIRNGSTWQATWYQNTALLISLSLYLLKLRTQSTVDFVGLVGCCSSQEKARVVFIRKLC